MLGKFLDLNNFILFNSFGVEFFGFSLSIGFACGYSFPPASPVVIRIQLLWSWGLSKVFTFGYLCLTGLEENHECRAPDSSGSPQRNAVE